MQGGVLTVQEQNLLAVKDVVKIKFKEEDGSAKMSDLDIEQNERIRTVEARINELENQVSRLIGELTQTMKILKIVGIGLGAMIGLDVQGLMM